MVIPFVALPLAAQLVLTVADAVPNYDVTPSCRGAAAAASPGDTTRLAACIATEKKARDTLVKEWSAFKPTDRVVCRQAASVGGEPTYTELLTCLEINQDLQKKPAG